MLQNARVETFTVFDLLRKNQLGRVKLPVAQIRVKKSTNTEYGIR